MYGPELWRPDEGGDWSYWDLWFAVLCVHDHGGDWDGFDAALTKIRGDGGEAKWSHLLDLRERLAAAGLDAVELVGDTITVLHPPPSIPFFLLLFLFFSLSLSYR